MFFSPLIFVVMLLFFIGLVVLFVVVQIGVISYAFEKMGIPPAYMFSLLMLSWFGSWVNIPITRLHSGDDMYDGEIVTFFGQRYVIPTMRRRRETVLAINLGGAVVPCLLSLYLLTQAQAPIRTLIAIAVVAAVTHRLARPVEGLGIAVPLLIPPFCAALVAFILAPEQAPLTAYVSGTMGTLIGADILNLHRITGLRAPVASIGGAGTFDGVFITGIIAVLLA
ncbi:MAG: DUF1614 domain-containing protein [Candidatus Tectomicrobia bacterium]|nr:DUF1614 domain-containing protein [Candidatus Tectomicrobia bacterium]